MLPLGRLNQRGVRDAGVADCAWWSQAGAPRFYVLRHSTLMGVPRRTLGVLLPLRRGPSPADAPAPVSTILSACALGCEEAAIR